MVFSVLGLDIGGANLKAAHSSGVARLQPFELWKCPAELPQALGKLLQAMPDFDLLAVTMTGELCDCFKRRRQGVCTILDAVDSVAKARPVSVWLNYGRFVELAAARAVPLRAAAANWLALACFAGRFAPQGPALIIDVGSTTTDIVPLLDGKPMPRGLTDRKRMHLGELVYTGVRRTPLCALLGSAVAAELFATTLDAYLLLGQISQDEADVRTADGRPATIPHARTRLARMLCADGASCPARALHRLAHAVSARQRQLLINALGRVAGRLPSRPSTILVAGSGEFLAHKVLDTLPDLGQNRISLAD